MLTPIVLLIARMGTGWPTACVMNSMGLRVSVAETYAGRDFGSCSLSMMWYSSVDISTRESQIRFSSIVPSVRSSLSSLKILLVEPHCLWRAA